MRILLALLSVIVWAALAIFLPAYVDKEVLPDVWVPTTIDSPGHYVWWMLPQAASLVIWFVLVTIGFIFFLTRIFDREERL